MIMFYSVNVGNNSRLLHTIVPIQCIRTLGYFGLHHCNIKVFLAGVNLIIAKLEGI